MNVNTTKNPSTRLNAPKGIDTSKPITFHFDGHTYVGYEGDTLASALLANGVKRVGRSFKLHRPRGLMAAGLEEPNGLVQLEEGSAFDEPNARTTQVPLYEGLQALGQNAWPTVNWDILGLLNFFHRLLPASFYYKSLFWPSWHTYECIVRKLSGLGKAPQQSDAQQYHKRNLHCDVLICGGGPAGLAAAYTAGQRAVRVVLIDDQEQFGGSLLGVQQSIEGRPALEWVNKKIRQLTVMSNVCLLLRTSVAGYFDHNFLVAAERINNHLGPNADTNKPRERLWRIRAKQVLLATGAIERPLVFANNDRPGIMLASAVRNYLNRYGVAAGQNIVVFTNNDSAYNTALELHNAGVEVTAIVDTRAEVNGLMQKAAIEKGIPLHRGFSVRKVICRRAVKGVKLAEHVGDGVLGLQGPTLTCDVIAISGGWTPTIHLYSQAGGSLDYNETKTCFVPRASSQKNKKTTQTLTVIGAANGDFTLRECLNSGYLHGAKVAEKLKSKTEPTFVPEPLSPEQCPEPEQQPIGAYWYTKGVTTDKQWLDFQYDVKVSDIELAKRENFISIEHVKRYTTNGMSVDQGKTSNFNTLAVMAELSGRKIPEVGTTKFRPPYHPITMGTIAGRDIGEGYTPRLHMPAHAWHVAHNGHMQDYGWIRPDYYLQPGEDENAAIRREVLAVRNAVGMFDGSPLGKLEVKGADAAKFLNRIYVNNALTLKPSFARYGLMCNENGVVIDDGVFVRFTDDHYMLHTTSGGATRIYQWLEEWLQCEWLNLDVMVSNVTSQWANVTVSGPKARDVVKALNCNIDFDRDAFPHMQLRTGTLEGIPARVLRASFTGEVTYEISVPARYGLSLWEKIYDLGQTYGITPYGIESLMALRSEKGYLHVGVDTDGTTNPLDLGWGVPINKKVEDFIGCRSLQRPNDQRDDRLQFVGLESIEPQQPLPLGGHIISGANLSIPENSQGYVTSVCVSPTLNRCIGLGLVKFGRQRTGEHIFVYNNGKTTAAKIVAPSHFDPKGERLNA